MQLQTTPSFHLSQDERSIEAVALVTAMASVTGDSASASAAAGSPQHHLQIGRRGLLLSSSDPRLFLLAANRIWCLGSGSRGGGHHVYEDWQWERRRRRRRRRRRGEEEEEDDIWRRLCSQVALMGRQQFGCDVSDAATQQG